ncbi:MAG: GGDEF domain-containing protein [Trueperaceae bacterium]|nr:GGDEF domain-containing protein [Trueperaceae bacterium]
MNLDRHRPLLLAVIALAVPTLLALGRFASASPLEAFGYPVLALQLCWAFWALARRRLATRTVMSISYVFLALFWVWIVASRFFWSDAALPVAQRLTPDVFMIFIVLAILAYLLFATRTALILSAAELAVAVAITAAWLVVGSRVGAPVGSAAQLIAYEGALAVTMLMLYALARSKDDHASALMETEKMREMAYLDALTHLPNRRGIEENLHRYASLALRHDLALSVVFFDIDDFKRVNDVHGHHVGDRVLEQVGRSVRPLLRTGDVLGRWGGEEFLIIAPDADHEQALRLAERVRDEVQRHLYSGGVGVTASFGVATFEPLTTVAELLERADRRLYRAKRLGKNRVVGASDASADAA